MKNAFDYFVDGRKKFALIYSEIMGVSYDYAISFTRNKRKISGIHRKLREAVLENKKSIKIYYSVARYVYEEESGELMMTMESKHETFIRNKKPYKR